MLAATRARPVPTVSVRPDPCRPFRSAQASVPAGAGSSARLPRSARALCSTSRSRRRATAIAGGSPARSAASWPHAAPISCPRLRRIVVVIPAARRVVGEGLDARGWARAPRGVGDGIHRDQVDVGVVVAQQVGQRLRVGGRVVDPVDERDLVGDPAPGRARMLAGGVDHLGHRPAPIERDEDVAERIPGGVQRDGERELRPEGRQPPDARHDAAGRDGDVARTQPEPLGIGQRRHGVQDAVEVEQRLAHAHEDDVREAAAVVGERPCRLPDLVEDLGRLQVPPEPELAGRAERAARRRSRPGSRCRGCCALAVPARAG